MWLELGKTVFEIFSKQKSLRREQKERLEKIFDSISFLLEETSRDLTSDQYPHGKCFAMTELSRNLVDEIKRTNILSEEKCEEIQNSLFESSKLEQEYAFRSDPNTIIKLSMAAGKFQALSLLMKI